METKLIIDNTVIICKGNSTHAILLYMNDRLDRANSAYTNALDKAKPEYRDTLPKYPTDIERYWFRLQDNGSV